MKKIILGVVHSKFTKSQIKSRKKKKLHLGGNIQKTEQILQNYRKKGLERFGIESLCYKLPDLKKIPPRKRAAWRYFYHFTHFANKIGYSVYNIEYISTHQLGKLFDFYESLQNFQWIRKFLPNSSNWSKKKIQQEMKKIYTTVIHFRTLKMLENMDRLRIQIALMGSFHANNVSKKQYKIIIVDDIKKMIKGTINEQKILQEALPKPTFYKKYKPLVPKMLRVFKKTKLYRKLNREHSYYVKRKE